MADSLRIKDVVSCATPFRHLVPNIIVCSITLFMILVWATDVFFISGSSRPSFLNIRNFLGPNSIKSSFASTPIVSRPPSPIQFPNSWISALTFVNYTSTLLSRLLASGNEPCRDFSTAAISIPSIDSSNTTATIVLTAGDIHVLTVLSLDDSRRPRCQGGDYFETDLSGPSWKSRPPILDLGNGSYTLSLQIHPNFASQDATFILSIVLLYRYFDGLKHSPDRFSVRRELRRIPIKFLPLPSAALPDLQICRAADLFRPAWSGRWTRHAHNDSCTIDRAGRYRCLDPDFPCEQPWCTGALGALESNGWVYSAHCAFRLFNHSSAWHCLRGKWILFWGDSNHVDTIRNLLNFVLGLIDINAVPRRFDRYFTNPENDSDTLRITNIFNGHWNDSLNYIGLASLRHTPFRKLIWKYFHEPGGRTPDVVILNSGLHDGIYWKSVHLFALAAEEAATFWEELMARAQRRRRPLEAAMPRIFYRTTVATGGYARDMAFNPSKMEAFDGILKAKLTARGVLTGGVVDEFDMTFPWHYDNRCNDGVHYGRKPAKNKWRDGQIGHQYFIDLMLAHVLLNAFCNG